MFVAEGALSNFEVDTCSERTVGWVPDQACIPATAKTATGEKPI